MYKIYKNGSLYKITNSVKCLEKIVDKFLQNWVKGSEMLVEKNGKIVERYFHF